MRPADRVALLLASLLPLTALALSTDKDQPMTVAADEAQMEDKKGVTVYRGNVIIQRGSMRVTGDTVVVHGKKSGEEKVIILGKPAVYRQMPDKKPGKEQQEMHASAERIELYPAREFVHLERNARVVQGGDVMTSRVIDYDARNNVAKARGGADPSPTTNGEPVAKPGRVQITIQPGKPSP
jgi:lipopolysaccharide export system protein LptA